MRNGARHKSYWKSNKNTDKSSTAKDCIPQKQYFCHISATEDLSVYYMRNPWRICIVTIRYNTFHQLASSVSVGVRFGLVRNYECIVYSLLCEHVG